MGNELKPCPFCGKSWSYASTGDYGSGYESKGYKIECSCGFAWRFSEWKPTEKEAIAEWNKIGSAK